MISTKYQLDETGFKRKKNLETLGLQKKTD